MDLIAHAHDIPRVAADAATIYGQSWQSLPGHAQQRWIEAIRDAVATVNALGNGETAMEKAACEAVRKWQATQRAELLPVVAPRAKVARKAAAKPAAKSAAKKGKK